MVGVYNTRLEAPNGLNLFNFYRRMFSFRGSLSGSIWYLTYLPDGPGNVEIVKIVRNEHALRFCIP